MSEIQREQERVADFYDKESDEYDERFETKAGKYINERQISIVRNQLGNLESQRVLEIAAGTGRFTNELVRLGGEVVVVDISQDMLKKNQKSTPHAEYICGTGSEIPIESNSIDKCLIVNALNHIPGHWGVTDEINRVLKSGGEMLANFPNKLSNRFPIALYVNRKNKNVGGGVYTKWFNIKKVREKLSKQGYTIKSCIGDRIVPVKIMPNLTVPMARATEQLAERTHWSDMCVSPFIKAEKK